MSGWNPIRYGPVWAIWPSIPVAGGALKRQCGSWFCNDLQVTRQCVTLKRADKSNPLELSTPLKIDLQELPLKDD